MPPHTIAARDYCAGDDVNCLNPQSPWYSYGRWILLACIIALAIIIFVVFSFISVRRRKRFGDNPLPLTGWARAPDKSQWEAGRQGNGANGINGGAGMNNGIGARNAAMQREGWDDSASDFGTGAGAGAARGQENGVTGVGKPEPVHAGQDGTQQYAPPPGPPPMKN